MDIKDLREEIDEIDRQLLALFVRRMEVSAEIGAWKAARGLPTRDPAREEEKLRAVAAAAPEGLEDGARSLFSALMALSRAHQDRLRAAEAPGEGNVVLIGMAGSGKSTLARLLGEALGREVLDTDALVEAGAGMPVAGIFEAEGEEGFRRRETAVLRQIAGLSGKIVAAGGGCVTREENLPLLQKNSRILWVRRDPAKLAREGRPLSLAGDPAALAAAREPLYRRLAEASIENDGTPEEALEKLLAALGPQFAEGRPDAADALYREEAGAALPAADPGPDGFPGGGGYQELNARTIDRWVEEGWEWGVPISHEEFLAAREGRFRLLLTPTKPVPREWLGDLKGKRVLGLASGGGQQMPLLTALGAECTVLDYSPRQLESERAVAAREGYGIRIVRADMTKPLPFRDGEFDLILHPVSNCYAAEVVPIWRECFRVLAPEGVLLAGLDNGFNYLFGEEEDRVVNFLPSDPLHNESQRRECLEEDLGMQFSHTAEEQIGGQLAAGFRLTGIYEDTNGAGNLHDHGAPTFWATRAVKD